MTYDDRGVDALWSIAREIKEARQEIVHQLGRLVSQLEDVNGFLAEINKGLPNPMEPPE